MTHHLKSIVIPDSAIAGDAVSVGHMTAKWVWIYGAFVATVDLEGSADGVNWAVLQAGVAAGKYEVEESAHFLRFNTTAYTSGTPTAQVIGHE